MSGAPSDSEFIDDRDDYQDRLEEHTTNPDAFDKLGNPVTGTSNPGRCHVCLAWTAYPYSDGSLAICPSCADRTETQRERLREEIRDQLDDIWERDRR